MKKISIVVSVYNEELALEMFFKEAEKILEDMDWDYELIFVNDGSSDGSYALLKKIASESEKVRIINFSRNFGHEAAMLAGVDHACGDGVVCMDADLQHPPEYIPKITEAFDAGFNVVNMVRTKNEDAGVMKRITSGAFYKVLNWMSPVKFENNASDFFAFDAKIKKVMKTEYRERIRFLRGFIQNVGFRRTTIEFEAAKRIAGESKYSIKKLFQFSIHTLFSFSDLPLKLGVYSGIVTALFGIALMVYTIINKVMYNVPAGYFYYYSFSVFYVCCADGYYWHNRRIYFYIIY